MSPFSKYLQNLRMSRSLRQKDVAQLMGYTQSFFSGIEIGLKGPPTDDFVNRLIDALNLSDEEQEQLYFHVETSQRKYQVPVDASQDVYLLVYELFNRIDFLNPTQITIIKSTLSLIDDKSNALRENPRKLIRKSKRTVELDEAR